MAKHAKAVIRGTDQVPTLKTVRAMKRVERALTKLQRECEGMPEPTKAQGKKLASRLVRILKAMEREISPRDRGLIMPQVVGVIYQVGSAADAFRRLEAGKKAVN